MKIKLAISSISFLSLFILSSTAFATSGACSSHGGVNCSVSNSYSSVVCNDGTSDGSTNFSDLQECKAVTNCDNGQVTAFYASRGLIGSSFGQSASANCESINNKVSAPSSSTYSSQNYLIEQAVDRKMKEYCVNKFGSNSTYNSADKKCACVDGYLFSLDGICSLKNDVLKEYWVKKLSESIATSTELKSIVDVNYIVDLVFKPENKGKTFKDLIIETYYKEKVSTSTIKINSPTTTPIIATQSLPYLSKSLKIGSRDPEVKILQSMLGVESTGYFGAKTREAVVKFQKLNKLPQSGLVGEFTRKLLNK